MINYMDYQTLINLKLKGLSNQKVADVIGVSRETVRRRWKKYCTEHDKLVTGGMTDVELETTKEKVITPPSCDSSGRKPRKYTPEIDELLEKILDDEKAKSKELASKKQQMTCRQIHELIRKEGHKIGLTTITAKVKEKRNRNKECYIAQTCRDQSCVFLFFYASAYFYTHIYFAQKLNYWHIVSDTESFPLPDDLLI